jgi:hypothetical protein
MTHLSRPHDPGRLTLGLCAKRSDWSINQAARRGKAVVVDPVRASSTFVAFVLTLR